MKISLSFFSFVLYNKCNQWKGKEVYIGLDLSLTTDNVGVSMTTYDKTLEKYVCKAWAFYPTDKEAVAEHKCSATALYILHFIDNLNKIKADLTF